MQANLPSPESTRLVRKKNRALIVACVLAFQVLLAPNMFQANETLITKNDTFFVPFTTPLDEHQASVVELFVSGDQGENWTLYQQRGPAENRFSFRAGADGEYWFSIRTLDMNGNCLLYTSPSPRDATLSRMPSSA